MKHVHSASLLITVALVGLLPPATGGCGLVLVDGPPTQHEQMQYFKCTQSNAGPILDVTAAG